MRAWVWEARPSLLLLLYAIRVYVLRHKQARGKSPRVKQASSKSSGVCAHVRLRAGGSKTTSNRLQGKVNSEKKKKVRLTSNKSYYVCLTSFSFLLILLPCYTYLRVASSYSYTFYYILTLGNGFYVSVLSPLSFFFVTKLRISVTYQLVSERSGDTYPYFFFLIYCISPSYLIYSRYTYPYRL